MKYFLLGYFLVPLFVMGQLITNTNQNPAGLVQNVLLGPGVTVSNITYNGSQQAIGYFDGTNTNLGIDEGIVLTTGTVFNNGNGPHGPNNSSNSGFDNNTPGYFRLTNLLGGNAQTYNASILEFDFIPYSDTVRFSYVFGSEEYPEYVGTAFNDIFAFFISGPGIPGGIQNIAKLTNGDVVAINNVNNGPTNSGPCDNCNQYTYNGDGSNGPYNANPFYIQYDGFTKVLEAVSKVECGKTYHLIIAIADVGDGIFDSGIFLQANSLRSKVPVEVEYEMSYNAFNDPTIMAEGCVTTTVTLSRPSSTNTNVPLTIPIQVTGTATAGTDYTNTIPTSVTFSPGQTQKQFTFSALQDGIVEGIETVTLTFDIPDPCGGSNPFVLDLKINDLEDVNVLLRDTTLTCVGGAIELLPIASGGVGPYTYAWSTGETTSTIFVNPTSTTTYTVSVTDNCLNQTATASSQVTIPVNPPLTLTTTDDITRICPYLPETLLATPTGGAGNYSYVWISNGDTLGFHANQEVTPSTTTNYLVVVTDQCGETVTGNVLYTITSPPLVLSLTPEQLVCPGDSALISVVATGGYGDYFYVWSHDQSTNDSVWVTPSVTTTYQVTVSDECQTFTIEGESTVKVIKPTADFEISSSLLFEDLPITFHNLSQGAVSYVWEFGDGQSSTDVNPNNTYAVPDTYYVTLIATNQIGCKDTVVKPIVIEEEYWIYVPNAFTPDGNRLNSYFEVSTINIKYIDVQIYNRWGERIFEAEDVDFKWDGTYGEKIVPQGVYAWKISYVTNSGIEGKLAGHITLLK